MSPAPDERDRIRAAKARILQGTAQHSNGALTIVTLAQEAGVPRNALTQRHRDLKSEFYAQVRAGGQMPDSEVRLRRQIVKLRGLRAKVATELAQPRTGVDHLVRAVNRLAVENRRLRGALSQPSSPAGRRDGGAGGADDVRAAGPTPDAFPKRRRGVPGGEGDEPLTCGSVIFRKARRVSAVIGSSAQDGARRVRVSASGFWASARGFASELVVGRGSGRRLFPLALEPGGSAAWGSPLARRVRACTAEWVTVLPLSASRSTHCPFDLSRSHPWLGALVVRVRGDLAGIVGRFTGQAPLEVDVAELVQASDLAQYPPLVGVGEKAHQVTGQSASERQIPARHRERQPCRSIRHVCSDVHYGHHEPDCRPADRPSDHCPGEVL